MRSRIAASVGALVALALATGVQGVTNAAHAADEAPDNSYTLNLRWKYQDDNPNWSFDEARMGTPTKLRMSCSLSGKTSPDADEQHIPAYESADIDVTYGEKSTHVIRTEATRTVNGTNYVDVHIEQCLQVMTDEEGFARDLAMSHGRAVGTTVDNAVIYQQANTDFQFVLTEGVIHPDDALTQDGQGGIPITIGLDRTYKGATEPLMGRDRKPAANSYMFEDKAVHHPSAEYTADGHETAITRAASGNHLDILSTYTGRYKTYTMTAKFADTNGVVNANGRYEIEKVEGDDLTGWTIYVKSNVKEATPTEPTVKPADTCGVEPTVVLPQEQDPDNPVWLYAQTRVNKDGEPDDNGAFVKVKAELADPVLYTVKKDENTDKPVQTEWTFDVAPTACPVAPHWNDTTTPVDTAVAVSNNGGPVDAGSTLQVKGPGSATIDATGTITVTPNADAHAGDVITVTVLDKDGNVVDTFTVTLTKVDQVIKVVSPSGDKTLARTGADLSMNGIAAGLALLAGAGALTLARRRTCA